MPSGIKINELPRAAQVSGSNLIAVESPAGTGTEAATVEQLRDYVAHDALEAIAEAAGDAVEAVEEKGAETLASIPEDYTKVAGDVADLKSAIGYVKTTVILPSSAFEQGTIDANTGANSTANNRIRAVDSIDLTSSSISVANGYDYVLHAYRGSYYIGGWTGSEFARGSSVAWQSTPFDMVNLNGLNVTKLTIVVRHHDNSAIAPADGGDIVSVISTSNNVDEALSKAIQNEDTIKELYKEAVPLITRDNLSSGYYYTIGNNTAPTKTQNASSLYTENPLNLRNYINRQLTIKLSKISSFGVRNFGFLDDNNVAHSGYFWGQTGANNNFVLQEDGYYYFIITIKYPYFVFSCNTDVATVEIGIAEEANFVNKSDLDARYYVTENGSDEADGNINSPLATFNKALELGASEIFVAGGEYKQQINITLAKRNTIKLVGYESGKDVIIKHPSCVLSESESLDSAGSTHDVYKFSTTATFFSTMVWLFQDNIADTSTLISADERHPLQKGRVYRCEDTKIIKCGAETLADAKTEIETSAEYKFFYDSTNHILYYSRPTAVSSEHPICRGVNDGLFTGTNAEKIGIEISNIKIKYMRMNLENTKIPIINDCVVANSFGNGCYTWDNTTGAKFYRCEAQRAFTGTTGDGFNAHSVVTGNTFAPTTTAMLFDVWAHDNQDDGYSDHERCEMSIYGGLFEYNLNGGGVTPALGSHCNCYNVMSRHNEEGGFRVAGTAESSEGGVGTQLICYNCISENNGTGSQGGGFIAPSSTMTQNDLITLYNCEAINEVCGYSVQGSGVMCVIDCRSYNCTAVKSGTGTVTVINGSAVT